MMMGRPIQSAPSATVQVNKARKRAKQKRTADGHHRHPRLIDSCTLQVSRGGVLLSGASLVYTPGETLQLGASGWQGGA